MDNYEILICGSGSAGLHVARVATTDGRGKIVGLFDPVSAQLSKASEQFPDAVAGDDYEHLLKEIRPDAVVVAGPDHLHAEQTVTALEHGCHVLVQKPLATTVVDAEKIIAAEAKTGLQVMTDHTMRYMYPWREMALTAKSGGIGAVFFVQGDYIHDMWEHYSANGKRHTPWRVDSDNPQNILLGGGCHPLDLMLWTIDAPVIEVYAYSNKISIPEFPSDDCYIVILKFDNGVVGKVYVTSGCSGHGMGGGMGGGHLAVYGTEGTLWKGKLFRRDQETVDVEDTSEGEVVGGHGWAGSVVQFLDVLAGKIANPIPSRDGAKVVAVCEAAINAIESGQPQRPAEF